MNGLGIYITALSIRPHRGSNRNNSGYKKVGKKSRVTLEAGVRNSGSELLHFELFGPPFNVIM